MSTESNARWMEIQRESPVAPEGASCWICLEEGHDEKGHRLMRNCACRGEASGFAHASCVAKYLVQEDNKTGKRETKDNCKKCNQPYQGDMALAVAIARLDLLEAEGVEHSSVRYLVEKMHVATCQDGVANPEEAIKILEECLTAVKSNRQLPDSDSKRLIFQIMAKIGTFYYTIWTSKRERGVYRMR